ncbi:hypothetical protein N9H93_02935 [Rhizobiaceae bacterium]|nr:hypothetical protein [Rhizobiaceae bacterium]
MTRAWSKLDKGLALAAGALAVVSAALPIHVWNSPASFAPPTMAFERLDDDPRFAAFRLKPAGGPVVSPPFREDVDTVSTGSVTSVPAQKRGAPAQPIVLLGTRDHALVRMPGTEAGTLPGEGMLTILRVGSRVDGGGRVTGFEQVDGIWTVRLGSGRRLMAEGASLQPGARLARKSDPIELSGRTARP